MEKTMERKEKYGGMKRAMYLENYAVMGLLPTPTVSDANGSGSKESLEKRGRGERNDLAIFVTMNTNGKNSHLNPPFVAEMMGFPTDWTELPFLNGEKNH
jgi:hypothetical protein